MYATTEMTRDTKPISSVLIINNYANKINVIMSSLRKYDVTFSVVHPLKECVVLRLTITHVTMSTLRMKGLMFDHDPSWHI